MELLDGFGVQPDVPSSGIRLSRPHAARGVDTSGPSANPDPRFAVNLADALRAAYVECPASGPVVSCVS